MRHGQLAASLVALGTGAKGVTTSYATPTARS